MAKVGAITSMLWDAISGSSTEITETSHIVIAKIPNLPYRMCELVVSDISAAAVDVSSVCQGIDCWTRRAAVVSIRGSI